MATKTAKPKKAAKKTAKKASPKKQKDLKKGAAYACSVCGLNVTVDQVCGCADFCDIICCGEQMQPV
jgi:rubrerythrin